MTHAVVPTPRRYHLSYLDGLRGLASLYVVGDHLIGQVAGRSDGGGRVGRFLVHDCPVFIWGTYAVCVFIVLSGYCLMLPVVKSADEELRGGTWDYLRRRGRRILPPYYAALLLSLLLLKLDPLLSGGGAASAAASAIGVKSILAHVFLVHNLTRLDALTINGPLWSVATEWQIYFLFPLFLLPVWRRAGAVATVAVGLAVGITPHYVFGGRFDPAMPQMVALFALGMAAAGVNFSGRVQERRWREGLPWGAFALGGAVLVVLLSLRGPDWVVAHFIWDVPLVGGAAALLIVYCTGRAVKSGIDIPSSRPFLLRILDSRAAVTLGTFSYSLYLVHWPLLTSLQALVSRGHLSPLGNLLGLLVALPVVVLLAYLFHMAFERPFMSAVAPRTERQAEVAAVVNPAP